MNDPAFLGVALLVLIVASVAEYLVKDGPFERYTGWTKVGLIGLRVFIVAMYLIVLLSTPNWSDKTQCTPDPESPYPASECN